MNFFNKIKQSKIIANEQGQGALEYILLLTVVVAIIVGLIFQFNKNFGEYAENYFGSYLKCLIQNGELPSLGSEDAGVTVNTCSQAFKPFTMAEGRPPNDSNKNNQGDSNKTSDGKGKKTSPNRFSSNGGSRGGPSGRGGRAGGSGNVSGSSFAAKGTNNNVKKDKIFVGGGGLGTIKKSKSGKNDDSANGRNSKGKRVGTVNVYDPDKDKKGSGKIKVRKDKQNDEQSKKSKSFRQAASIKKNVSPEVEVELSFGDYIRYLIIAAILIVLLFVVGGQIFQASKGSE